ncbi:MAG: hypothetical protein H0Z24_05855 [Thermosipho sp. (in: Bacteria)]|nr:hypothetical protein [Thermosipho sp. (in: thermotogales)]
MNRELRRKMRRVLKRFSSKVLIKANAQGNKISTTELVNLIFNFLPLYSGIKFYPYQEQFSKRIIRSILENDGAEITALFSRQSGKSETIATTTGGLMIILPKLANMPMFANDKRLQMFKDGLWVGIFAPSQRQAQITYNRIKSRIQSRNAQAVLADPDFNLEFSTSNGQTVALTNGSFATAISASDGSNIEGESFKLLILEECQDISDFKIRKSILPMGSAYNSTVVKIGTATTFKGDFYESIQRNKKDYERGKSRYKNHFEYNYKVVMKYNPKYEKYVMKQKYRLGEFSDEFRMSYNLEWILERGMFIDIDKFEKLCCVPDLGRVPYDKTKNHVAGIDLAKKEDSTVVTIVEVDWENPVVVEKSDSVDVPDFIAYEVTLKDWLEIQGTDYNEQYYIIMDYLKNFNISRLVIDATAEGSMADRLRANLPYEVIPFVFSSVAKSDLYKHFDREIKAGRIKIPANEETKKTREYKKFIQQMTELQKDYRGQILVVSHPPQRGAHDDFPDSLALAVWGAKEEGTTRIEVVNNNHFISKSDLNRFYLGRNRLTARRR